MSKPNTNAQGQEPRISRRVVGEIVIAIVVCLWMIVVLWPSLVHLREYRRRIRCGENLTVLGKTMIIYACDYDDKYPTVDKWCDLLTKHTEVSQKEFICPSAGNGRCHYAMNPNANLTSSPEMVVLFETERGWNQFGGPEILTIENHEGKGGNISFNDQHAEFVKPEPFDCLKWNVEVGER